ncbi:MAG: methyltransferase [Cellvibrionaceae bacterium]|nr:methyltransferase [Cellvibrionaceae bacterium]
MTALNLAKLVADAVLRKSQSSPVDRVLWVVDEAAEITELIQCLSSLQQSHKICVTNRCDTAAALSPYSETVLNDFDFTFIANNTLPTFAYRISKQRSLVQHVLLEARRTLHSSGTLLLCGRKKEGIKNYFDLCRKKLGFAGSIQKYGDAYLCELSKTPANPGTSPSSAPLKSYTKTAHIQIDGLDFSTKPGIYGWNKLDQGSAFLMQQLERLRLAPTIKSLLDLGCGYGYLAVRSALLLQPQRLIATDNNITAVDYCQQNLQRHFPGLNYHSTVDDCGQKLGDKWDMIVCNPPFHQGFGNNFELTQKFLQAAHRLLAPQGKALFVFNAFVPAEKPAARLFKQVEQLANNQHFKVYMLTAPYKLAQKQ